MVAGDEEAAFARAQAGERRDVVGEVAHRAVDQVAGDGDDVDLEAVDGIDDRLDVRPLDRRPDVDVADLGDREAVERRGQAGDRNVDPDDARGAARVDEAPQGDDDGGDGDGAGRRLDQRRQRERPGPDRVERGDGKQGQVAHEGEHEQRREQPHADQADPGELSAEAARAPAARAEAEAAASGPRRGAAARAASLPANEPSAGTRRQPTYAWKSSEIA